jgi:hypothetical protein
MIQTVAVDNVVLAGNTGRDSTGAFDEVKGGAHGAIIFANLVHNAAGGIIVGGDETGTRYLVYPTVNFEAENVHVWDNVILNDRITAFRVVGCHDCIIANNTFWAQAPYHALMLIADALVTPTGRLIPLNLQNIQIVNNIFESTSRFTYMIGDSKPSDPITMTHNLWWWAEGGVIGSDIPFLGEPGSLHVNPDLVAPPTNLRPALRSPVIGQGIPVPFDTSNAAGSCWSSHPNIGAS